LLLGAAMQDACLAAKFIRLFNALPRKSTGYAREQGSRVTPLYFRIYPAGKLEKCSLGS
jgi:hypothetical protein